MSTNDGPRERPLAPDGERYSPRRHSSGAATRRMWRVWRSVAELVRENQWVVPLCGLLAGLVLPLAMADVGRSPDPGSWAISVDRARDTLMSMLSLVFAGLSIAMAVASVTVQNVVSRFSLRMVRIYQRELRDKLVLGVFAMTATFILAEQVRLRSFPAEEPAPVAGVAVSILLLVASGVAMIWYIGALSAWFRVDRTASRVAKGAVRAAHSLADRYADLDPAGRSVLERPANALTMSSPKSGFLSGIDVDSLFDLARTHDVTIVVDHIDGSTVHRGQAIGWVVPGERTDRADLSPADLARAIDVTEALTLEGAVDFRIVVLVDIAIMALSPAVNDPNTAAQVIDEMTFLFPELARVRLGSVARSDDEGNQRVVIRAPTLADYLELATDQIMLYGAEDPAVRSSLRRLADVLEMLELGPSDRRSVDAVASELRALQGSGPARAASSPG